MLKDDDLKQMLNLIKEEKEMIEKVFVEVK